MGKIKKIPKQEVEKNSVKITIDSYLDSIYKEFIKALITDDEEKIEAIKNTAKTLLKTKEERK